MKFYNVWKLRVLKSEVKYEVNFKYVVMLILFNKYSIVTYYQCKEYLNYFFCIKFLIFIVFVMFMGFNFSRVY